MSKKKKEIAAEPQAEKQADTEASENEDTLILQDKTSDDQDAERMALYDNLYPKSGEDSNKEAEESQTTTDESSAPNEESSSDEGEDTEVPEKTDEITNKKPTDTKMVPYSALHEEREKRKSYKQDLDDVKKKLEEVLSANLALEEKSKGVSETEKTTEEIDDYESEIINLKKEIQQLKASDSKRNQEIVATQEQQRNNELRERVSKVDKELEAEGYYGFDRFKDFVAEEIRRKIETEEDISLKTQYVKGQRLHPMNNEEGWKLIFKEKVYPDVYNIISKKAKNDLIRNKESLQDRAQMIGNPGGGPIKGAAQKKTQTYEEFLQKARREASAMA